MTTNIAGDYEMPKAAHSFSRKGADFGAEKEHYADPTSFLEKNDRTLPQPTSFSYKAKRKDPVVTRKEKPVMGRRSGKDFIKENAVEVIMAEPKKRPVNGPDYLKKNDFGKVPKYLGKVKKELAAEQDYIQQCLEQEHMMTQQRQPQMQLLEESERQRLLTQLKTKWEQVNHNYQNMTHIVTLDTIGKVRRKEEYESQLQQLEKSIEKMSKPLVFVQADQEYW
jgi:hypothetical protein